MKIGEIVLVKKTEKKKKKESALRNVCYITNMFFIFYFLIFF